MMQLRLTYEEIIVGGWPTHRVKLQIITPNWDYGLDDKVGISQELKLWCLGQYGYSNYTTWVAVHDLEKSALEAIHFAKKSDALIFVTRWQAVMLDWNGEEV